MVSSSHHLPAHKFFPTRSFGPWHWIAGAFRLDAVVIVALSHSFCCAWRVEVARLEGMAFSTNRKAIIKRSITAIACGQKMIKLHAV